jgi:hypothetical protein
LGPVASVARDRAASYAASLAPDVANALVSHRSVNNCIRDRAVPHEGLKRPCIDTSTSQGVACRMPQHVRVDRERQVSSHA